MVKSEAWNWAAIARSPLAGALPRKSTTSRSVAAGRARSACLILAAGGPPCAVLRGPRLRGGRVRIFGQRASRATQEAAAARGLAVRTHTSVTCWPGI